MNNKYTVERNIQILIELMKAHGIKKIVISPGATNVCFVASVQQDEYFEKYSCVDERSAAYLACGLAEESGEPVALSCTCATASRNYMPALTEAYYSKLPILAITSTPYTSRIGHHQPQVIDRSVLPNDTAKLSVELKIMRDTNDLWSCNVLVNKALLALRDQDPGPVHINLLTTYHQDFTTEVLPEQRVINRLFLGDLFPEINEKRIAIFVGAHKRWSNELIALTERFCEKFNGVVLCDHTSNYKGKYKIQANILVQNCEETRNIDLLIHLGDISGAYMEITPNQVWRVNPDGEIRDTYGTLRYVFEMKEEDFFGQYVDGCRGNKCEYYDKLKRTEKQIRELDFELPFSNPWIAKNTVNILPKNVVLHLGILNTLRSWNFFEIDNSINIHSNTGGFGIDGCVSTLVGASLANRSKLYFGVVGDLAFFYDMNILGNHHIGNNLRLLIINNGRGTEFTNYNHRAAVFGEQTDEYMAAAGHFANKSLDLVKNFARDLGFVYLSATTKEEYQMNVEQFVCDEIGEASIVFEVFTDSKDESDAIELLNNIKR